MITKQSKSETLTWFAALFALCAAVVWVRTSTVKATYHYVQQEKELGDIGRQIQDHRIRWLKLTSPKRLEALAVKLDLVPADPSQRMQYLPKSAAQ